DGSRFGSEFSLTANPHASETAPSLAALADGRFLLGWSDDNRTLGDTSFTGIHGQIFDPRDAAVHLVGTPGDDDYVGTSFDDTMQGGGGDDHLDGGAGNDTAIYAQSLDQYTLQDLGGGQISVSGPEGSDVLANFEHLQFSNVTLDIAHLPEITSNGGAATAT